MINPQTKTEQLLFCTTRIETSSGTGTGFFFRFQVDEEKGIDVLVTNKHVVANADEISFSVHIKENGIPTNENILITHRAEWFDHPTLDLCCTLVNPLFMQFQAQTGKEIFYLPMPENLIWTHSDLTNLSAMEDVVMVGYPIGLWDEIHNLPLLRKGVTSTHPAIDFKGEKKGVIDAACFPGSSGSPICIINEGGYVDKNGTTNLGGGRFGLLGILFAGPIHNAQGEIIVQEIPTQQVASANTPMMINLGYYIKADQMLELKKVVFGHLGIGV
jgi:hypothetical protein